MTGTLLLGLILVVIAISYRMGVSRAVGAASGGRLHSRPVYHGALVALWAAVPLAAISLVWGMGAERAAQWYVTPMIADQLASATEVPVALQRVMALASGTGVVGEVADWERAIAQDLSSFRFATQAVALIAGLLAACAGLFYALRRVNRTMRARNSVENAIRTALILCSVVAILTTLGIVVSLVVETLRFFSFISPVDFLFGTVWNPGYSTTGAGNGSYGILPLLAGTLMITVFAMAVAIPVGLMSAIWLTQYAPARLRGIVKPLIEVLAGIPTIVYGFFALVTLGPALSDLGAFIGLTINATSALTAGVIMGVMIIPFISSLSDDIIRQVPTAMRDGSLGLGATKSETIRKVVVPAALPGIVGAILLAVSRAIGETMIVVLAAGNAPVLRLDPFQATSTFTVTIVQALTGDSDFASPQSLVAFALGMTLFLITLALNLGALFIVRKYREQYE